MKRVLIGILLIAAMTTSSVARAELKGTVIFKDTIYGALTGGIIGAATMVFTEKPEDHLMNIAYGAAAGSILGAGFGAYESTTVAEFSDGNLYLALPSIQFSAEKDRNAGLASVDLLRVRF